MTEHLIQLPPESVDRFYVGVDEVPENGIAGIERASSAEQVEEAVDRVLADNGRITWAEVDSFEKLQADTVVAKKLAAGYARMLRGQLEYAERKAKTELKPSAFARLVGLFSGNVAEAPDSLTYMRRDSGTMKSIRARQRDFVMKEIREVALEPHRKAFIELMGLYHQSEHRHTRNYGYTDLTALGREMRSEWEAILRDRIDENGELNFDVQAAMRTWVADDKGWGAPPTLKPWERR